eukprot:g34545.t1
MKLTSQAAGTTGPKAANEQNSHRDKTATLDEKHHAGLSQRRTKSICQRKHHQEKTTNLDEDPTPGDQVKFVHSEIPDLPKSSESQDQQRTPSPDIETQDLEEPKG